MHAHASRCPVSHRMKFPRESCFAGFRNDAPHPWKRRERIFSCIARARFVKFSRIRPISGRGAGDLGCLPSTADYDSRRLRRRVASPNAPASRPDLIWIIHGYAVVEPYTPFTLFVKKRNSRGSCTRWTSRVHDAFLKTVRVVLAELYADHVACEITVDWRSFDRYLPCERRTWESSSASKKDAMILHKRCIHSFIAMHFILLLTEIRDDYYGFRIFLFWQFCQAAEHSIMHSILPFLFSCFRIAYLAHGNRMLEIFNKLDGFLYLIPRARIYILFNERHWNLGYLIAYHFNWSFEISTFLISAREIQYNCPNKSLINQLILYNSGKWYICKSGELQVWDINLFLHTFTLI